MNAPMAPEHILRATLRVLFIAGCASRNWTLAEEIPRKQINDLWEALHEIPDLLCRWRDDAEEELLRYFDEYNGNWSSPDLRAIYDDALRSDAES